MTIDTKDILNSILSSISRIDYIKPEEIPGIDLYMDQVTTFMEEHLRSSKRHREDKILTKTLTRCPKKELIRIFSIITKGPPLDRIFQQSFKPLYGTKGSPSVFFKLYSYGFP